MKPETRERRSNGGIEIRAAPAGSDSPGTLVGYASVFNRLSENLGGFREMVRPGAFTRTLRDADVICYLDHQGQVLGRNLSGTLRLSEDAIGLKYECDLPDTSLGRDVAVLVGRGDYRGSSFAFIANVEEWEWSGPLPVRTVVDADLFDTSVVDRAAYNDTTVAMRSMEKRRADLAQVVVPPNPNLTLAQAEIRLRLAEAI
jgi:uncharacterized protein